MRVTLKIASAVTALVLVGAVSAKLPAPALSDEAKAKAAEAAAKTVHAGKVDNYKLCLSIDKTAAHWNKTAKSLGKEAKAATATPPCADPGAFVWPLPVVAAAPATPAVAAGPAPAKKP